MFLRRQAVIARTFGISPAQSRYTSGVHARFCAGVPGSAFATPAMSVVNSKQTMAVCSTRIEIERDVVLVACIDVPNPISCLSLWTYRRPDHFLL